MDQEELWSDGILNGLKHHQWSVYSNLQMHRTWKIWKTHYLYSILETLFHTFPPFGDLYQKKNAQISVLKRSKHVSSVQIIPKFEEVSFHLFFWSCYEHIPRYSSPQIDRILRNLEIMEETSSRSYPGHAVQSFLGYSTDLLSSTVNDRERTCGFNYVSNIFT